MPRSGALAQLGERLVCKQEVAGSIPAGSIGCDWPQRFLAFLALAGCGGTEIDSGEAERLVRENLTGPAPESVDCPERCRRRRGSSFECQIRYRAADQPR